MPEWLTRRTSEGQAAFSSGKRNTAKACVTLSEDQTGSVKRKRQIRGKGRKYGIFVSVFASVAVVVVVVVFSFLRPKPHQDSALSLLPTKR